MYAHGIIVGLQLLIRKFFQNDSIKGSLGYFSFDFFVNNFHNFIFNFGALTANGMIITEVVEVVIIKILELFAVPTRLLRTS